MRSERGMPWQVSHKRQVPSYAEAKGAYWLPPLTGEMPEGQRGPLPS